MRKRFSIGLTGGIGSGKTTIANMFESLGAALIDTDQIAHQITAVNGLAIPAIFDQFGDGYLNSDGSMDRTAMRQLVFADISAKLKLENILHPLIRLETEKAEQTAKGAYLIFVVPLLVESGNWKNRVNRTLVVDCTEKTQVQRVMLRNGMTEVEVKAIMNNQASRKQRLEAADDVIFNEGELTGIQEQVLRLHQMYLTMAEQL